MKLLYFSPYAVDPYHSAITCENLKRLHDEGHELFLLTCEQSINRCFYNPDAKRRRCALCTSMQVSQELWLHDHGVRYHKLKLADFMPDPSAARDFVRAHAGWKSEEDLRAIRYHNGLDVGRSVLGTLLSLLRELHLDLERYRQAIDALMLHAILIHEAALAVLQQTGVDKAYVFNGRISETRAVLMAVKARALPWCMVEVWSAHDRFGLFDNGGPHDIQFLAGVLDRKLQAVREGTVAPAAAAAADQWFQHRQRGGMIDGKDILKFQKSGALPPGFEAPGRRIVFYIGSRDEYICLDGWEMTLFQTQEHAIREIVGRYAHRPDVRFYVRVHPNLSGLDNAQTRDIAALAELPRLTVLPSSSPVSTYALLAHADLAIVFGSTVGVEALHLGRPALLLAPAPYHRLPGILSPASTAEACAHIDEFIEGRHAVDPQSCRDGALAYGLLMTEFGVPFRHFRVTPHLEARTESGDAFDPHEHRAGLKYLLRRAARNPLREFRRLARVRELAQYRKHR